MFLRLTINSSSDRDRAWAHDGALVRIGRDVTCELVLPGERMVSSQHAQIELRGESAWLSDCGSRNGTFLNGERIAGRSPLKAGDRINLGQRGPEIVVHGLGTIAEAVVAAVGEPRGARSGFPAWLAAVVTVGAAIAVIIGGAIWLRSGDGGSRALAIDESATVRKGGNASESKAGVQSLTKLERPDAGSKVAAAEAQEANEGGEARTLNGGKGAGAASGATETPVAAVEPPAKASAEIATPAAAPVTPAKASQSKPAYAVLKQYCYSCHGQQGSNEGGFNVVLNRDRLVSREYVVPGKAEDSYLFQRVRDGEMPPKGKQRPSAEEIVVLRTWIDGGAPAGDQPPPRRFIAVDESIESIAKDLRSVNERDRRYVRYFTLTHLYDAGASDEELRTFRNALSKLLNSLSWKRQITVPTTVDPEQTIMRIDLRDYDWTEQVWDIIAATNPYGIIYTSPAALACYADARTEMPSVRADWFVFKASRPPLYERVLRIPDTIGELERMLMVDLVQDIRQETAKRAGFNGSGVSQNNRLIERHDSTHGAYWRSYDFASNIGSQNLFEHPLGPAEALPLFQRRQAFDAAGGEVIFSLPNGLQAYLLVDAFGRRIERGPTKIVSDPKQADRTVVNGISCMSCHYAGIIKKSDEIREHVERNRKVFGEANDILALYAAKETMDGLMEEDAKRFQRAVEQTGSAVTENGEPVVNMAKRFEEDLDAALAAAEIGMQVKEFRERLEKIPEFRRLLGGLLAEKGTVKRQVFTECFGDLAQRMRLGRAPLHRPD